MNGPSYPSKLFIFRKNHGDVSKWRVLHIISEKGIVEGTLLRKGTGLDILHLNACLHTRRKIKVSQNLYRQKQLPLVYVTVHGDFNFP